MSIISKVLASFGAEDKEQRRVILFCEGENIDVWHVPNNTYTDSIMQKIKNQLLGVRKGIPDLGFIAGANMGIIEMKTPEGTTSKEQRYWIGRYREAGIPAIAAYGADQAIRFIEQVRDGQPINYDEYEKSGRRRSSPKRITELSNEDIF